MSGLGDLLNLLLEYAEKLINGGVITKVVDISTKFLVEFSVPLKEAIWLITH